VGLVSYQSSAGSQPASGWTGWIIFAASILIVNGLFGAIEGLAGIFRDKSYFAVNGEVLVFDYTAWGWIHLIIGILLVLIGVALFRGSMAARVAGIIIVGFNLLAQFIWIGASPWWSLIAITFDILILYALIIHGGELIND
jgi:hypothetical protein